MNIVRGNLINLTKAGLFDVIAHGCNCFNTMGGGIAYALAKEWPDVERADARTISGSRAKLGTCLPVAINDHGYEFTVVNCYTQYDYGGGLQLDYDALRKCLAWIAEKCNGCRIGLPKIGAGLAGGDWSRIAPIMDEMLAGQDATVVVPGES